ncbi:MAG TPA: gliding-motility protein MglA [Bdellovibrionales bacterium]|nr:MAG: gliding-motility protein MglA [Bdellovibrionales bacterium GWB1_52_6]OFZ03483.1 MAG: gliding-motility protein MglA [Bdellovibrionales bacterium GWA1_52_35]OFZ37471.1 MAG: gliding-motility protein MglA [Bdellovibrionales bacterium GWC1_52_8]HAR44129.1 gliding-motility protein MglA [Bdellovibrionales bacterium]HCM41067.1 gliding-motility protein MglA [Bdellovibrionales bacterium]
MSFINYANKEINCKIIYVGPGLCGKTTNIQYIYEHTRQDQRGKMVTLSTENERTLFFDFLPLSIGEVRGYKTRFHLYSIPGQTFYDVSREFILKGVDGLVFVADSQAERMEANIESFEGLEKALERQGYDLKRLPLVLQYNKRDLPTAVSIQELEATFNPMRLPYFEAVANHGQGVMDTLQAISQRIIKELKGEN